MDIILTGRYMPDNIKDIADCIYNIESEKQIADEIL
jgi:cob(I)alamin adenosyltransferase